MTIERECKVIREAPLKIGAGNGYGSFTGAGVAGIFLYLIGLSSKFMLLPLEYPFLNDFKPINYSLCIVMLPCCISSILQINTENLTE